MSTIKNLITWYPASKSAWLSRGSHVALSWLPRRKRYVETTWFCRVAATSSPRFLPRLYHVIGGIFYVDTTWFCRSQLRGHHVKISHIYHIIITFPPRLYHIIGGIFYVDTTWFCRVAVTWSPREKFTYISHYYHVSTTFIPRYRWHFLRGDDVILYGRSYVVTAWKFHIYITLLSRFHHVYTTL